MTEFVSHFNPGLSDQQLKEIGLIIAHWAKADVEIYAAVEAAKEIDRATKTKIFGLSSTKGKLTNFRREIINATIYPKLSDHLNLLITLVDEYKLPRNLAAHGIYATTDAGHGLSSIKKKEFYPSDAIWAGVKEAMYFCEVAYRMAQIIIAAQLPNPTTELYIKGMAIPSFPTEEEARLMLNNR